MCPGDRVRTWRQTLAPELADVRGKAWAHHHLEATTHSRHGKVRNRLP
jgi:hypothetical protein